MQLFFFLEKASNHIKDIMQSDEVIWQVINQHFCSYKVKTATQNFCRNEYNVTGLCNRQSCPLANSRYATIRMHDGILYLYVKTPERAHSPAKMWEKIKLSKNYEQALGQIDKELIYWPNFLIHKCKQRVTKITQMLIKMRKLRLKERPKLIPIAKKVERREATRELKALSAARLEKAIEKELVDRLKNRAYGDAPLNVSEKIWRQVLEGGVSGKEGLEMEDDESDEEDEEDYENENENEMEHEFVSDIEDESDIEDVEDFEEEMEEEMEGEVKDLLDGFEEVGSEDENDIAEEAGSDTTKKQIKGKRKPPPSRAEQSTMKHKRSKRGAYVEVEYEQEMEPTGNIKGSEW